jgi:hypothetical protein
MRLHQCLLLLPLLCLLTLPLPLLQECHAALQWHLPRLLHQLLLVLVLPSQLVVPPQQLTCE